VQELFPGGLTRAVFPPADTAIEEPDRSPGARPATVSSACWQYPAAARDPQPVVRPEATGEVVLVRPADGPADDAVNYRGLRAKIRSAFALALHMQFVPEDLHERAVGHLVEAIARAGYAWSGGKTALLPGPASPRHGRDRAHTKRRRPPGTRRPRSRARRHRELPRRGRRRRGGLRGGPGPPPVHRPAASQCVTVVGWAGSVSSRTRSSRSWSRLLTRSCWRRCSSQDATTNCSRTRLASAASCQARQ
jgi:hypothetical protein